MTQEEQQRWAGARPGQYGSGFDPYTDPAIRKNVPYIFNNDYFVGVDGHTYRRGAAIKEDPAATERMARKRIDAFLATPDGRRLLYERQGAYALQARQGDIDALRGQIDPSTQSYYQQMQRQIESAYAKAGEQQMARAAARGGGSIQSASMRQLGNEQRSAYSAENANAAAEAQRYGDALRSNVAGLQGGQADAYLAYTGGGIIQQQALSENRRQFDATQELARQQMFTGGAGDLARGIVEGGFNAYSGAQYRLALEEGLRGRGGVR